MESLERENLRLIERCDELVTERVRAVCLLEAKISDADKERHKVEEQAEGLEMVHPIDVRTQAITRDTEAVDRELHALTQMVEKYYGECFRKSADLSAMMMLERLEIELEKMYAITAKMSQQWLAEKQMAIERGRREELRRKKQEAQALEAQRKMKAALERATQPIHQRVTRPLNLRMLPTSYVHHDVDLRLQDEQIQEELLFGAEPH
jgi:hypothetical protein